MPPAPLPVLEEATLVQPSIIRVLEYAKEHGFTAVLPARDYSQLDRRQLKEAGAASIAAMKHPQNWSVSRHEEAHSKILLAGLPPLMAREFAEEGMDTYEQESRAHPRSRGAS